MDTVIVITGPTAAGKTGAAVQLAKKIDGEIISADSMQVYRYMDIGTAKPTHDERHGVAHYMLDEVYPDEDFSVVMFREKALKYINDTVSKGKIPIIAGGTGLYISSLVSNINYPDAKPDKKLRNELKKLSEIKGNEYLHNVLEKIDPVAAAKIHTNDLKRIIRALEVFEKTGNSITYHEKRSRGRETPYRYLLCGLAMNREVLYERINKRVDKMIDAGLFEETKKLVNMGYENCKSMEGLGYKEMYWYLKGRSTHEEAIELIKRNTRRYAKRQMTWFRKMEGITWF